MMKPPPRPQGSASRLYAVTQEPPRTLCVAFFAIASTFFFAATLEADQAPITALIDREISEKLAEEQVSPAPLVDDAAFARRATLDLAGRIPTSRELEEFEQWTDADKRTAYVDRLLSSPDSAVHLRNELDLLLLAKVRRDEDWRKYLLDAMQENRSWDRMFREILDPEKERPGDKGPAAFLRERVGDLDKLTTDASALLFGVNISCAKCHDHPLVLDWQQDHYYGLASFFERTYRTRSGGVAERFDGALKFTTNYGEEKNAKLMFLTGTEVAEPSIDMPEERKKELDAAIRLAQDKEDAVAPTPEFSPRAQLVEAAFATDDLPMLARNVVNRTWARLIGRGLVEPLDQLHSDNPATHPELLDEMTRAFVESGYDLKTLIRGIVLSETYARSCEVPDGTERPASELFAVGIVRPLTPRQMATSLYEATTAPDRLPGLTLPPEWQVERLALDDRATGLSERFENPEPGFQVGVDESLLFSNGDRIQTELLSEAGDRLVGFLDGVADDGEAIDRAFRAILSRSPALEERETAVAYLVDRKDRRSEGMRQVVWALLATAEFRFNH